MKINEGLLWKLAINYAQREGWNEFNELLDIADDVIRPSDVHEINDIEKEMLVNNLKTMSNHVDGEEWYEVELTRGDTVAVNEYDNRDSAFEAYLYYSKQPRVRVEIYLVNRGVRSIL